MDTTATTINGNGSSAPNREAAIKGFSKAVRSVSLTAEQPGAGEQIRGLFGQYSPLAYMLPWEVLDYIEILATYNPDYSQAVENIKMLANTGHNLFVDGKKRTARRVKDRLEEKARQIQARHGGVDGLIEKLLDQAAVYGAMAGEWILNDDLTDVVDFADVNPKSIRFFWEDEHWAPYQKLKGPALEEARKRGQKIQNSCAKLNELTFVYHAFDSAPGFPYGTPPFLAALTNIAIQRDMVTNMAQIVKKIGLLGIIDLVVKSLPIKPNETEEAYQARAGAYLDAYVQVIEDMVKDGGVVHYDDVEAKTYQVGGNAAGATNIFKQNEELIFSGLKSMPSVQGRCVTPDTKILTADLEWVRAGDLVIGEELIGFDEDLGKGRGKGRVARMKPSFVECNDIIKLPCVKIVTDKGEITVSEEHPLVGRHRSQSDRVWFKAKNLTRGDNLIWFGNPWEPDDSYDSGYIAGIFDGEGSLGFHGSGKNGAITMSQLPGEVLDETVLALKRLGFEASVGEGDTKKKNPVSHLRLLGGKWNTLRLLGTVRPWRLRTKGRQCWDGASLRNGGSSNQIARKDVYAKVLSVKKVGTKKVVALQTSSRTFFSEGLMSHNSYSTTETYAGVAYEIILRNTSKYQRAVKRMLESGYWLMATMWGEDPDSIKVSFNNNRTLNRLQEAQAEKTEIDNAVMLWLIGLLDQLGVAQRLGFSEPKTEMDSPPDEAVRGRRNRDGGESPNDSGDTQLTDVIMGKEGTIGRTGTEKPEENKGRFQAEEEEALDASLRQDVH